MKMILIISIMIIVAIIIIFASVDTSVTTAIIIRVTSDVSDTHPRQILSQYSDIQKSINYFFVR